MAQLPVDDNTKVMQLTPASPALARTVDATVDTSTQITFNAATTMLRVYAKSQPLYLKWGTTAVTASNFDEVVPANQLLDFAVPKDSNGNKYAACTIIEQAATATAIVIEK